MGKPRKKIIRKIIKRSNRRTMLFNKKNIKVTIKKALFSNIVEISLIIIGLSFLLDPIAQNIKNAFSLVLISFILLAFLSNSIQLDPQSKNKVIHFPNYKKHLKKLQIPIQERIALVLIAWTLLLFLITGPDQIEIFFILVFIGFIITRELTDTLISKPLKHRLDAFIIIFLIAYIFIISEKIINVLNM